jgi:hypothetical protein
MTQLIILDINLLKLLEKAHTWLTAYLQDFKAINLDYIGLII